MEQYRLFDDFSDKVKRAIQLFQMFEDAAVRHQGDGYYLAFSGGKKGAYAAKMVHEAQAHIMRTTVDPPSWWFIAYPDVSGVSGKLTM